MSRLHGARRSRALLATLAAGFLLAAACTSDGDTVDRAELEANDAAEAAEDVENQLREQEEEELRQELEGLRAQIEAGVGGGADTGGADTGGGNVGNDLSYCNNNVAVNSVTSCPFAYNVVDTMLIEGLVFDAYSPTTDQFYAMSCVDFGDAVECTGGNNARVVYLP